MLKSFHSKATKDFSWPYVLRMILQILNELLDDILILTCKMKYWYANKITKWNIDNPIKNDSLCVI